MRRRTTTSPRSRRKPERQGNLTARVTDLDDQSGLDEAAEQAAIGRAARKKAMDLLARREYGGAELAGRLRAAGFDHDLASDTVATLSDEGLQDDARFAASFVAAKSGRGSGPLRIRQALMEKGLSSSAVDRALAEDDTDWVERARAVRLKRFGPDIPAEFPAKAKQMRFLNYRGFDSEQIEAAFEGAAED